MNTNDTQQEHIYNERIQEFFPLFDKKDDPIYNARVDFNTVKFLTERADWDWNEDKDKNKACGVILQECDKTARQELEDKAKEELNKYITNANNINDDVKDKKVSIYGNHASITLEDNKKEFKISEFLNSDFCQKNGISGFSTLHSDGKSGMHGFVAEEGGKKIRHYVVTDGSYEMTLNWYVNGEKCTIKVNIDKEGVDLIEPNSVTEQLKKQLEVNKDVKIGGLFLHEIKFREKGKVNEVQHDGKDNQVLNKSSEIAIKSNSRDIEQEVKKPVQKHQATHMNREIGSQTPPLPPLRTSSLPPKNDVFDEQGSGSQKPNDLHGNEQTLDNQQQPKTQQQDQSHSGPQSNSRRQSYDSGIEEDFNNEINSDENRKPPVNSRNPFLAEVNDENRKPPVNSRNPFLAEIEDKSSGEHGKNSKDHNSETLEVRTELVDKNTQFTEENISKDSFSENILEKIEKGSQYDPIRNWLKNKIKENNQSLNALEEKLSSKSNQGDVVEKRENDDGKPLSPVSTEGNKESLIDVEQGSDTRSQKSSSRSGQESAEEERNFQKISEVLESWKEKRLKKYGINEDVKETSFNTPEKIQSELQKDDLADVKTVEGPTVSVSASTPNSISDSGYISPTNGDSKSQTDLKQVGRKLEEHINLTPFEELKNTLGQENLGLKPADQSQISEETKKRLREVGLLKDSSTDVKTNDSGYSSPTHANHEQSRVNPGQLKASLMNVEQRDDTLLTEFTSKLDKETQKFPLKPVDQKEMSEQTKEHLLAAGLLKDSSTDIKTVAEQENNDTNPTVDKNSKLYKLLEKDKIQLEVGVIKEERKDTLTEHTDSYDRNRIALGNRNKRPLDWAKRIAESQEKDTNKSILM